MQLDSVNSGKFLLSKEDYLHNKQTWKKYLAAKTKGNGHFHLLYLLMCEKNIFRGFSPIVKENKITCNANGNKYYRLAWELYRLSYRFNTLLANVALQIYPLDAEIYPLIEGLYFKFNPEYINYLRDKIQKIIILNNF